jgi:hypothetical protein
MIVNRGSGTGLGSLTISNGTDRSAVVKLVLRGDQEQRLIYAVYVRKNDEATISAVDPAMYDVWSCFGSSWSWADMAFQRDQDASKADEPLAFSEERDGERLYYSQQRITLHKVPFGNWKSSQQSPRDFDRWK